MKKKKTMGQLKRILWGLTSKIVRLRYPSCYTCDKSLPFAQRQAGHYWSQGGHGSVRYNLDNIRTQCRDCNYWKSGNRAEFRLRLRKEIGDQCFDDLAREAHETHKFTRQELTDLIDIRKLSLEVIMTE